MYGQLISLWHGRGVPQFNPKSFISQVTAYLDNQKPTPELNCLRLVVLSGVALHQIVSLHTKQVDLDHPGVNEAAGNFLRSITPVGGGYYFPVGTSHTTLGGVREAWEAMCLVETLHGPDGQQPKLETLELAAAQVLAMESPGK